MHLGRWRGVSAAALMAAGLLGAHGCSGKQRPFDEAGQGGGGSSMMTGDTMAERTTGGDNAEGSPIGLDDGNAEAGSGLDALLDPDSQLDESLEPMPSACSSGATSTCNAVHGVDGVCGARVLVCSNDGAWPDQAACNPNVTDVEQCDAAGADENCDGRSNEGCPCSVGEVKTCREIYGSVGDCAARTLTCLANGSWPAMDDCAPAGPELCNQDGRDENCDGRINERPPCEAFVSLSVSWYGACGISTDGAAYCWGENESGLVGDGTRIDRLVPTRVLSDTRNIVTGARTCAVLNSGAVNCWGDGQGGLGDGSRDSSAVPIATQPIAGSPIDIQGLGHFNCVLMQGGAISCWGFTPAPDLWALVPTTVDSFTDVVNLAVSDGHVCGVLSNGTVQCVGGNSSGQLGDGTLNSSAVPVQVVGIDSARQVTANQGWTCALLSDGRVQCWGSAADLGDGVTTDSSIPVTVQGLTDAVQVSAGMGHACAVRRDGTIYCWGSRPLRAGFDSLVGVRSVHCGSIHDCALLSDGSAYCWGFGEAGRLGAGPNAPGGVALRVWGP